MRTSKDTKDVKASVSLQSFHGSAEVPVVRGLRVEASLRAESVHKMKVKACVYV